MKILITEQQHKKLFESKDYYDFWDDYNPVYDILSEFLDDKKNGINVKKWNLIPFEQYRNALIQFVRYGEFMRFPTKYIDRWATIVTENTLSIQAITELAGHSSYFPTDDLNDFFYGDINGNDEGEKFQGYDDGSEYLENLGFYDWCKLPDGSEAWSDYGLEPLIKLIMELEEQTTPEQKIVVINKILDVYHQRGDLASAFIQGGSKSLSQISYPEESVNENIELNEMPYPSSFDMEHFKSINSFKGRVEYCRQHLPKIGEGSSRMVFKIDDEKVIKLAKNRKGLEQNKTEADKGYNENYFDCIAKVFDYDDNYKFIEMELALPCKKNDFKRITGYDFETYVNFIIAEKNDTLHQKFSNDFIDDAYDNYSLMTEVIDFSRSFNLPIEDFLRLRQYGIVKRNGEEQIVVVDYGLTFDIWNVYYSKKR